MAWEATVKICLISGEYPPMQGGVGDYTAELGEAYFEQGHQVLVITSQAASLEREKEGADADVAVPESPQVCDVKPVVARWNWRGCSQVLRIITEERPDVVNVQYQAAAYGMQAAVHLLPWRLRLMRRNMRPCPRIIVTYHDLRVPYLFPKAGFLRWWAVLALARWADAVIVTNVEDEATLMPYEFISRMARIPIGSNIAPLPPENYDRAAWRKRWRVGSDEVLLAHFGFLNASKGVDTLIRALRRLVTEGHSVKLLMVGGRVGSSDPTNIAYAEYIEMLIDDLELGDHVLWTGYAPEEDVSANLLAADVCVLPYKDGVSLRRGSFMAAAAHGLPIVSTRYPVAKRHIPNPAEWWYPSELKGGGNILLVPPDDEIVLSDAISRLIASPGLREHLGQEAKKLSQQFEWSQIAKQTLELYEQIRS